MSEVNLPTVFKPGVYEAHVIFYTKINNVEVLSVKVIGNVSILGKSYKPN